MAKPVNVIGLPEFVGMESGLIADLEYRRFAHFRWNDRDIWLIGTMVWHHILSLGSAYLRCATDRTICKTPVWVNPRAKAVTRLVVRNCHSFTSLPLFRRRSCPRLQWPWHNPSATL
jgi:hypothetical protein